MESLILPTINKYLLSDPDQHGFRPEHSITSALRQLTTDIAMGFKQRKSLIVRGCVAVDLSCFRGVKSTSRKGNNGFPQGSKLSPSLFSFYIADMPRPTEPVKRVCYADDITVWATGVKIPELEDSLNGYLKEINAYLKDNSVLISSPKSLVTLFTPDTHQAKTDPKILIEDSQILGVQLNTLLSFNKHSNHVTETVSSRNNILKACYCLPTPMTLASGGSPIFPLVVHQPA